MKKIVLMNSNKKNGFSLIEMIVVIVILGILAATVTPKFLNFKADAQTSVLQTIRASIEGAVERVHSKSIVTGAQNQVSSVVQLAGGTVIVRYGYPSEDDSIAYWTNLGVIDANSDISINTAAEGGLLFYSNDLGSLSSVNTSCVVVYNQANAPDATPTITLNECD